MSKKTTPKHSLSDQELLEHASDFWFYPSYAISGEPELHMFGITVSLRSEGKYAVLRHGQCWVEKEQKWTYESLPSSRTKKFLKETRYSRDKAIAIALRLADETTVNGLTLLELREFRKDPDAFRLKMKQESAQREAESEKVKEASLAEGTE